LADHLGLAFLIYGAMFWVALGLIRGDRPGEAKTPGRLAILFPALVFATVLAGALVAGVRACYAYHTFPLMNGHLVPPEVFMVEPWWKNFGYNMATGQFDHRLLAWIVLAMAIVAWGRSRGPQAPAAVRAWSQALAVAVGL